MRRKQQDVEFGPEGAAEVAKAGPGARRPLTALGPVRKPEVPGQRC